MTAESQEKRTYKIGEVCRIADVQPYVLRYWETEFASLAPTKSGGGQRMYSQREIDIILRIKQLLYSEGFTIAGAKKRLEVDLEDPISLAGPIAAAEPSSAGESLEVEPAAGLGHELIDRVRKELRAILALLD